VCQQGMRGKGADGRRVANRQCLGAECLSARKLASCNGSNAFSSLGRHTASRLHCSKSEIPSGPSTTSSLSMMKEGLQSFRTALMIGTVWMI
jgi:hypothetical protein